MAGIGQQLETTRRMRNLSIEQVSADTRISARFLQALEDEQFDELPAPVYVRGFLRSYANYLKIDPQPLLEELSRYEESDGYVVRGPAPWRGPTRPPSRGASADPFRPRPPEPAKPQVEQDPTRLAPAAFASAGSDSQEWNPDPEPGFEAEAEFADDDGYDYEQDEPAWVRDERRRGTEGVLLARPVPLRTQSNPPRVGIAVVALAIFGAAAVGAYFLFRGDGDGGAMAGTGDDSDTPTVQSTPGGVVEVRTPTPGPDPAPTVDDAEGQTPGITATPGADGTPEPEATSTQGAAGEPTPVSTSAPTATPTVAMATATPEPPTAVPTPTPSPTPEPSTPTPTPAIVHPLGTSLCGSGVNPCGDPPYLVVCGPNGWFIDPTASYANPGWPTGSASRIGEASSVCQ